MSTMEVLGAGYRAARAAARQRRAERAATTRTRSRNRVLVALAEHGLAITGFACFTTAAAMVAVPLGLVVAGVAMFILEKRAAA